MPSVSHSNVQSNTKARPRANSAARPILRPVLNLVHSLVHIQIHSLVLNQVLGLVLKKPQTRKIIDLLLDKTLVGNQILESRSLINKERDLTIPSKWQINMDDR